MIPGYLKVFALGLLSILYAGCEQHDQPSTRPLLPAVRSSVDASPVDSGSPSLAIDPPDPTAPAGNLREEIANFSTLDACVRSRAPFDPVVADAVEALGYDNLKRDACRVVQAAKTQRPAICQQILSLSLRDYCQESVAAVSGRVDLCPMATGTHDPLCVALAQRDERLCRFVPGYRGRACQGIIRRNAKVCGTRAKCRRMVARWSALMPKTKPGKRVGTAVSMDMSQRVGARLEPIGHIDLRQAVDAAVIQHERGTTWLLLGSASTLTWPPDVLADKPRLSLRLRCTEGTMKRGRHPLDKDDIEFRIQTPGRGSWRSTDMAAASLNVEQLTAGPIGAPVRLTMDVDVGVGPHPRHFVLHVNTFVRDSLSMSKTDNKAAQ